MSDEQTPVENSGPLAGVRVLDLTRILAGPTATQLLGDFGADIIKIERPVVGDDTRRWGPPYVQDADGRDTRESAYYLCANRNKRSITIDIANPEGAALIRRMLKHCDILAHNFKVGGPEKFGLGYDDLKDEFPGLVYCAVTGFGQTGPKAKLPGYDYLAQALGGIMSITGEPGGNPVKVGVGIADVMCGMYATAAILAALHHRDKTGQGQMIDLALVDAQVAWLINEGTNYLTSGQVPVRRGNTHANIVPYQLCETSDGYFILATGNDSQFQRFAEFAGRPQWISDERYATNTARLAYRAELCAMIEDVTRTKPANYWIEGMERLGVPACRVNDLAQVFSDPQTLHRGMKITMPHPQAGSGSVDLIGNPLKLSETPISYRHAPPTMGQHTDELLAELLDLDAAAIAKLRVDGIV